jgi:hypothetical protein
MPARWNDAICGIEVCLDGTGLDAHHAERVFRIDRLVVSIAAIVVSLLDTMAAALLPDMPLPSRPFFRTAILAYWAFDVGRVAFRSNLAGQLRFGWNDAWHRLALVAQYAKTIDTIPP